MEYLGPLWPADVWPADDIPFCSIFTYFQYSLIHDLAQNVLLSVDPEKNSPKRILFKKKVAKDLWTKGTLFTCQRRGLHISQKREKILPLLLLLLLLPCKSCIICKLPQIGFIHENFQSNPPFSDFRDSSKVMRVARVYFETRFSSLL